MNPMASALSKGAGSIALKVTIVVAAAVGGTGMVASNVFAALTATATNTTGGQVQTGTLKLELANSSVPGITSGFTSAINAMGPGDTVNRYVELRNTGNLDGLNPTLLLVTSDTNTLVESTTAGLQITITGCSIAWTSGGICNETSTAVLGQTPVKTLKTSAQLLTLRTNSAGVTHYLKITTFLPAGSENILNGVIPSTSILGQTATLTWTFVTEMRTATNTNS